MALAFGNERYNKTNRYIAHENDSLHHIYILSTIIVRNVWIVRIIRVG